MTFRDYLRVFRERWRLIISILLLALILSLATTKLTSKVYTATAQVYVQTTGSQDALQAAQAAAYVNIQVATFADIVRSRDILDKVRTDLNQTLTTAQISDKITASAPASRSLVDISASDGSSNRAAELANSTARAFVTVIENYSRPSPNKDPLVHLVVTSYATAPSSPTTPNALLNTVVALVVGVLVGLSAAVLREVLDNRVKSEEKLAEVAAAPMMGAIVDDPKTARHPIAAQGGGHSLRAENFRQMRANLQFANVDVHPRVIAVTSSIPGEGKTTVSINLASTLSESGFRVCLVDADLRRPTVATVLGLVSPVGLTNVLIQQIELSEALQEVSGSLSVLAAGPIPPNPSEVLSSSYVRSVIRSLLDTFDYVVIDTAPLLPVADGSEVAALADGTLLVAQHKKTTEPQIKRATQSLRRVDASLIGVVLNRVRQSRSGPYGYSYYSYRREEQAAVKPRPQPRAETPEAPAPAEPQHSTADAGERRR